MPAAISLVDAAFLFQQNFLIRNGLGDSMAKYSIWLTVFQPLNKQDPTEATLALWFLPSEAARDRIGSAAIASSFSVADLINPGIAFLLATNAAASAPTKAAVLAAYNVAWT